jgi:hypothetical protein
MRKHCWLSPRKHPETGITETNKMQLILFGLQDKTFGAQEYDPHSSNARMKHAVKD